MKKFIITEEEKSHIQRLYKINEDTSLVNEVVGLIGKGLQLLPSIIGGSGTSDTKVKQFCDACLNTNAQPTALSNRLADMIRDSVQGIGTTEQKIYSAFNSLKSFDEFCSLVKSYQSSYNVSLYDDLDGDIDTEDVWVQIFRPLRDLALKKQQSAATPSTKPTGGGGKMSTSNPVPAAKPTGGGGKMNTSKPTPVAKPIGGGSRMTTSNKI